MPDDDDDIGDPERLAVETREAHRIEHKREVVDQSAMLGHHRPGHIGGLAAAAMLLAGTVGIVASPPRRHTLAQPEFYDMERRLKLEHGIDPDGKLGKSLRMMDFSEIEERAMQALDFDTRDRMFDTAYNGKKRRGFNQFVDGRGRARIKDECAATGQSCAYGPHGPNGLIQCEYCGRIKNPKPRKFRHNRRG